MEHNTITTLLRQELKPGLGCTEPAAVGLATAKATKLIDGIINKVIVTVSPNLYKNAYSVTIPNTKKSGLELASALGIILKNPEKELQLFEDITENIIEQANIIVQNKIIEIRIKDTVDFYIDVRVESENGFSEVYVIGGHTNFVKIILNGKVVFEKEEKNNSVLEEIIDLSIYSIKDIVKSIESINIKDIAFLQEAIEMNLLLSEKGLEFSTGLGVGVGLRELTDKKILGNDIVNKIRIAVACACDARMGGLNYCAMTFLGSGNQGIEAIVPVAVFANEINAPKDKVLRALTLCVTITAYIKQYTGKLSPLCGAALSGAGASAAITWLMGGTLEQIEGAIKNMCGNVIGMICDGAKNGCALKLTTCAANAVIAAYLALDNIVIDVKDGIISETVEDTIKNVGKISYQGMSNLDNTILEIVQN